MSGKPLCKDVKEIEDRLFNGAVLRPSNLSPVQYYSLRTSDKLGSKEIHRVPIDIFYELKINTPLVKDADCAVWRVEE